MISMTNSTMIGEVLRDPTSSRIDLNKAMRKAIVGVHQRTLQCISGHSQIYLVGNGYEFDEFAARLAEKLGDVVSGVACIWQKPMPYPFPNGWRSFLIQQETVEPATDKSTLLLVCQSIVADEFEVITAAARVWESARFERVVIAAAMIERKVGQNLLAHFSALSVGVDFATPEFWDADLSAVRDTVLSNLDDRPMKLIPPLSKWMMEREFGPRPKNDPASRIIGHVPRRGG